MLIITCNTEVSSLQTVCKTLNLNYAGKEYRPKDLLILREVHRHAFNYYA